MSCVAILHNRVWLNCFCFGISEVINNTNILESTDPIATAWKIGNCQLSTDEISKSGRMSFFPMSDI